MMFSIVLLRVQTEGKPKVPGKGKGTEEDPRNARKAKPREGLTTPRLGNGGAELCHPEKQPFSYEKEPELHTEGHTEGPGKPQRLGKGNGC